MQTQHFWQAYFNGSAWQSRQMIKNLSVFLADHLEFWAKLTENLSVFLVDGPGFVSEWPMISCHFGQITQPAFLVKLMIS